jgi:ferric enterobactin receptor
MGIDRASDRSLWTVRRPEVLVQKRTGRHTGWVAYTLSKVEEVFPELEPDPFPATHDQRHELKIVNILDFGRWYVSKTFVYTSGKPYPEPAGLEAFELPFGGTIDRVVAGVKNAGRRSDYYRLDLALNREVPLGDSARGIFSLTLFNAYNRQNAWYKEFNVVEGEIVEKNILLMGLTLNAALGVKF